MGRVALERSEVVGSNPTERAPRLVAQLVERRQPGVGIEAGANPVLPLTGQFPFPRKGQMKKAIVLMLATLFLSLSLMAQDAAPSPTPSSPAPAASTEKSHNFFVNKINTPVFFVQAAGAFWQAREINGNASNFTTQSFWHRYLPNAYREAFAEMAAGDAIAYGFHKAHFKGHKWVERGILFGTAAALYITANRNLKAYNKTDCDGGLQQFCH